MSDPRVLEGSKAIVVEDSVVVTMELEERLAACGAVVAGAFASVASARDATDAELPDLAVLDVRVRDGTTLELACVLRARGVCCVFVTGYSGIPELPTELVDVPRLSKPMGPDLLERTLARLLEERRRADRHCGR